MFFRDIRLTARLAKAHALYMRKDYTGARKILNSITSIDSPAHIELTARAQLGEIDFLLSNFEEARTNLVYCLSQYQSENFETPQLQQKKNRITRMISQIDERDSGADAVREQLGD